MRMCMYPSGCCKHNVVYQLALRSDFDNDVCGQEILKTLEIKKYTPHKH